LADAAEVSHEYGLALVTKPERKYHGIVMAVSHKEFDELAWDAICLEGTVIYDVKGVLDRKRITARL